MVISRPGRSSTRQATGFLASGCLQSGSWRELVTAYPLKTSTASLNPEDQRTLCRFYLSRTSSINNWDLVDISAGQIVGGTLDPNQIGELERLAHSTCLWERRIAIIATSFWIKQAIVSPTLHIAGLLVADPHDLIHKAVGWMLREVGKKDIAALHDFLDRYLVTIPRTMLRYAIERFPEPLRQHYLQARFR